MSEFIPRKIKPEISYKDFSKVDIRVGTIIRVEDIEQADALVRLVVDFGNHTRNILAGIKKRTRKPKRDRRLASLICCKPCSQRNDG